METSLIPKSLIEKIKNKEVCFFLGAGISMSQDQKIKSCPSSFDLAKILFDHLKNKNGIDNDEQTNIMKLSSELVWQNKSRSMLNSILKTVFGDANIKPLISHRLLAKFDIPLITTNFDRLIELAYEQIDTDLTVITNEDQLTTISGKHNILIKIHGDITNPSKCIITEDDYYSWMSNNSELKNLIRVWMITKSVIFIGYSINDINFRQLIIELIRKFDNLFNEIYFVTPNLHTNSYNYRFITNNLKAHFIQMDAQEFLTDVDEIVNKNKFIDARQKYIRSATSSLNNQRTIDKLIAELLFEDIKLNQAGNLILTPNTCEEVFKLSQNYNLYKRAKKITNTKDESSMILIPKGEFIFGGERLGNETIKVENVSYDYYIDKYLITNKQYKIFLAEVEDNKQLITRIAHPDQPKGKKNYHPSFDFKSNIPPKHFNIKFISIQKYFDSNEYDDYPVVYIDWWDAYAYAKWANKRLPSEIEWEKAARGKDGRAYPFGNIFDFSKCNVAESEIYQPTPVSKYKNGLSPYGCFDMCGNVWEWCETDFNNFNDSKSTISKIVKGGSASRGAERAKSAFRNARDPNDKWFLRGFRCVKIVD